MSITGAVAPDIDRQLDRRVRGPNLMVPHDLLPKPLPREVRRRVADTRLPVHEIALLSNIVDPQNIGTNLNPAKIGFHDPVYAPSRVHEHFPYPHVIPGQNEVKWTHMPLHSVLVYEHAAPGATLIDATTMAESGKTVPVLSVPISTTAGQAPAMGTNSITVPTRTIDLVPISAIGETAGASQSTTRIIGSPIALQHVESVPIGGLSVNVPTSESTVVVVNDSPQKTFGPIGATGSAQSYPVVSFTTDVASREVPSVAINAWEPPKLTATSAVDKSMDYLGTRQIDGAPVSALDVVQPAVNYSSTVDLTQGAWRNIVYQSLYQPSYDNRYGESFDLTQAARRVAETVPVSTHQTTVTTNPLVNTSTDATRVPLLSPLDLTGTIIPDTSQYANWVPNVKSMTPTNNTVGMPTVVPGGYILA